MNFKKNLCLVTALTLILTSASNVYACTSLAVTDTKGNVYHGRTIEFSSPIPTMLTYMPAGSRIESALPDGKQGMAFNTKYAFVGMTAAVIKDAKQPFVADGLNDQGLSLSGNELNPSASMNLRPDSAITLSGNDFGSWVLGNFKTVEEIKKAFTNNQIQVWLPKLPLLGNVPVPIHYAIHDKTGGAIVVEFTNGMANIYDNPVNAMTNGPVFTWHLENLNNYTFTNLDKNVGQLGKLKLATEDAGIALTALPGAETSQGRFVKAAFYSNYVSKGSTPDKAINQLAHILNNFDRPDGLTVDGAGGSGDGPRGKGLSSETSQTTMMKDLSRGKYYIRNKVNAMSWVVVDLSELKNVNQVRSIPSIGVSKAGAESISHLLK